MAKKGWQTAAKNWEQRMQTASQSYVEGINAVVDSPMEKAAQAATKYAEGVNRAVSSGKYAAKLREVSTQDWKRAAVDKASRLATGATAAKTKVERFWNAFGPFQEQVTEKVRAMPTNTMQERIARAVAQMQGTHEFQERYSSR